MLSQLQRALVALPSLIDNPSTPWQSLAVRYETPHVDRVWLQWEPDTRLFIHQIFPCDKPLFHPHPWPSAVAILDNFYTMELGHGDPGGPPPEVTSTVVLGPGSIYEMAHPWGWHSVGPTFTSVFSVMVTGRPWPSTGVKHPGAGMKHDPLSPEDVTRILERARKLLRK